MSSDAWEHCKLGGICSKIGSGATPRGGQDVYLDDGPVALIRSQNVLDFSFSSEGLVYIDETQAALLSNVEVEAGDVLLNITGDSVARVCQAPSAIIPARVNQHVAIIRPDRTRLDAQFLKYYLLNPRFKNQMLAYASVGATRKALTKGMVEDFDIALPPLFVQRRIASILSALDDKIELNRQTNATLEAIAQAIFKAWFVDFEFPVLNYDSGDFMNTMRAGGADTNHSISGNQANHSAEMVESALGLIPAGWRVGRLGKVCEFAYGKGLKAEDRIQGDFPVVGSNGIVGTHNEYLVKGPGIVIGRKGTIGKVTWLHQDFYPIDTTFYIRDLLGVDSLHFHYFLLKEQDFKKIGSDSAVPGLNRNQAYDNLIVVPARESIVLFNNLVQEMFESISSNDQESATLAQIRDALLPRLMRGEVVV